MDGKFLGKITFAEFGTVRHYPFFMGLQLQFSFDGCGIGCGGKYTENMSKSCKWEYPEKRQITITEKIDMLYEILKQAKVNYVSQLVGKPVEITIVNNTFSDFRILTEVL